MLYVAAVPSLIGGFELLKTDDGRELLIEAPDFATAKLEARRRGVPPVAAIVTREEFETRWRTSGLQSGETLAPGLPHHRTNRHLTR